MTVSIRVERLDLFDLTEVEEMLDRSNGRRGRKKLRRAVAAWRPAYTRSELEERFQKLIEDASLPLPNVNTLAQGTNQPHEVDCFWPRYGIVVELDSFAFHRTPRDRERDFEKTSDLESAGLRVVRLSWRDVTDRCQTTTQRLRNLLDIVTPG